MYCLIKRFVPAGSLPSGVVVDIDKVRNIQRIDKEFYDGSTPDQQRLLWRAKGTMVVQLAKLAAE